MLMSVWFGLKSTTFVVHRYVHKCSNPLLEILQGESQQCINSTTTLRIQMCGYQNLTCLSNVDILHGQQFIQFTVRFQTTKEFLMCTGPSRFLPFFKKARCQIQHLRTRG